MFTDTDLCREEVLGIQLISITRQFVCVNFPQVRLLVLKKKSRRNEERFTQRRTRHVFLFQPRLRLSK
jgi:hypothetical protein